MANDPFYDQRLGMPFSENTRRFTVYGRQASGKTQTVDPAALEQLRDYLMHDLVGAGIVRVDKLPPRRQSIVELQVAVVCANWGMAYRVG